jgi:hypothetical protein
MVLKIKVLVLTSLAYKKTNVEDAIQNRFLPIMLDTSKKIYKKKKIIININE